MIRFSKIFFYYYRSCPACMAVAWCYAFLTLKPVKTPFYYV